MSYKGKQRTSRAFIISIALHVGLALGMVYFGAAKMLPIGGGHENTLERKGEQIKITEVVEISVPESPNMQKKKPTVKAEKKKKAKISKTRTPKVEKKVAKKIPKKLPKELPKKKIKVSKIKISTELPAKKIVKKSKPLPSRKVSKRRSASKRAKKIKTSSVGLKEDITIPEIDKLLNEIKENDKKVAKKSKSEKASNFQEELEAELDEQDEEIDKLASKYSDADLNNEAKSKVENLDLPKISEDDVDSELAAVNPEDETEVAEKGPVNLKKSKAKSNKAYGRPTGKVISAESLAIIPGNPNLSYPYQDKLRSREGTVTLQATVSPDGSIRNVRVVDNSGTTSMAQEAVRKYSQWKYKPLGYTQEVQKQFQFRLEGEAKEIPAKLRRRVSSTSLIRTQ